ncbi:Hypothetical predicted protein, partial [Paramuricea clavata]
TNYTATSSVEINDGKWHFVEYAKESNYFTLKVDMISTNVLLRSIGFRKMDYDDHSFLGEIAETPYKHDIKIQDFVWKVRWDTVNFVTGLFQTYEDYNAYFRVLPEYVLPIFNRKLPRTAQPLNYKITSSTPKPMSNTPTPSKHRCTEGPCSSKDESKFYVVIVLVNNCRGDVLVTTNVSGQLKIDHLKPTKTVVKSKRWKTKKWLSVSVVDATTNRTVDINGHSVIHLEPTIKKLISLKAPKMVDRSITRATTTPQTNTFSNPSRANDIQRKFPAERIVSTETDPVQPLTAEFEKFKDSFSATEGKGRQVIGQDANTDTG